MPHFKKWGNIPIIRKGGNMQKVIFTISDILGYIQELLCISKISIHIKTPILKYLIQVNYKLLKIGGIS